MSTFGMTVFAWIFFRAESVGHAISYISGIFSKSLFTIPEVLPKSIFLLIFIFTAIEWIGREQQFAIEKIHLNLPKPVRWAFYYAVAMIIFLFQGESQEFIYFQF